MKNDCFVVIYEYVEGECLFDYWNFDKYKEENVIEKLFIFFENIVDSNYVVVDFYDSSIIYDFENDNVTFCDMDLLVKRFKSHGKMMWEYANGIDDSIVNYMERDIKSISNFTVLHYDYTNNSECLLVLRELSTDVGKRLRKKKLFASNVSIWIKYNNFKKVSKQITLDNSIHTDEDIYYYSTL